MSLTKTVSLSVWKTVSIENSHFKYNLMLAIELFKAILTARFFAPKKQVIFGLLWSIIYMNETCFMLNQSSVWTQSMRKIKQKHAFKRLSSLYAIFGDFQFNVYPNLFSIKEPHFTLNLSFHFIFGLFIFALVKRNGVLNVLI